MTENKDSDKSILKFVDLIKKLPRVYWDYTIIIRNENITLEDILENPFLLQRSSKYYLTENLNLTFNFVLNHLNPVEKGEQKDINDRKRYDSWSWEALTTYEHIISFNDIITHPELPWDKKSLSHRSDLDIEYVKLHPEIKWNFREMSARIKFESIIKNPDLPWDYDYMSSNPGITIDFVKQNLDKNWYWHGLSENVNIADIEAYPQLPWRYIGISYNKTLTSDFLIRHINKDWDTYALSANRNLDFNKLIDISLEWDYFEIAMNESVTKKFIQKHIHNFTDDSQWYEIYKNKIITLKDIENNSDLFWNYDTLSIHPELTAENILSSGVKRGEWNTEYLSQNEGLTVFDFKLLMKSRFRLNFYLLSSNPNITYDFIYENREKGWDWHILSNNSFKYENKKRLIIEKIKNNYLERKKRKGYTILDEYIIPDLNKIILEY